MAPSGTDFGKIPIWRTLLLTFHDFRGLFYVMPLKVLIAAVVTVLATGSQSYFGDDDPTTINWPLEVIVGIAYCFCIAPFSIAIYRFVVLGDVVQGYVFDTNNPRFMGVFQFAVLFSFPIWLIVWAGPALLGFSESQSYFAFIVAFLVLSAALSLLFPAIATDQPTTPLKAVMELQGNFGRAFVLVLAATVASQLVIFLVILLASAVLLPFVGQQDLQESLKPFNLPLTMLWVFLIQTLLTILEAHIFLAVRRSEWGQDKWPR